MHPTASRRRALAGLVGAALLGVALPSSAARPCGTFLDPSGDAAMDGPAAVPGDANDDLRRVSLRDDGTRLVVTVQLESLAVPNPAAPLGQRFEVGFRPRDLRRYVWVAAVLTPYQQRYDLGDIGWTGIGTIDQHAVRTSVSGRVDPDGRTITITAPWSAFRAVHSSFRPGLRLDRVVAASERLVGQMAAHPEVGDLSPPSHVGWTIWDEVVPHASYVVGSCR
jgi:hypothetical protein